MLQSSLEYLNKEVRMKKQRFNIQIKIIESSFRILLLSLLAVFFIGCGEEQKEISIETYVDGNLTWQDDLSEVESFSANRSKTWNEANKYCSELSLAGIEEWRLPSILELKNLSNKKEYIQYYSKSSHWSSSVLSVNSDKKYYYYFGDFSSVNRISYDDINETNYIRCVHGNTQEYFNSYFVADNNLTWQDTFEIDFDTDLEANQYCSDLNLSGFDDWKLPSSSELVSLYSSGQKGVSTFGHSGSYVASNISTNTGIDIFGNPNIWYTRYWVTQEGIIDNSGGIISGLTNPTTIYPSNTKNRYTRCVREVPFELNTSMINKLEILSDNEYLEGDNVTVYGYLQLNDGAKISINSTSWDSSSEFVSIDENGTMKIDRVDVPDFNVTITSTYDSFSTSKTILIKNRKYIGTPKTGQTNIYYANDDGDYQLGENLERNDTTNIVYDYYNHLKWYDVEQNIENADDAEDFCWDGNESLGIPGGSRLPGIDELIMISSKGTIGVNQVFKNINSDQYWSSDNQQSWRDYYDFSTGERKYDWYADYTKKAYICVKSLNNGIKENLYQNVPEKEVTNDNRSGVMWQDDITSINNSLTWSESIDYCENLIHASFNDWRLPNLFEIYGATKTETTGASIESNFSKYSSENYWSSTSSDTNNSLAYSVKPSEYTYKYSATFFIAKVSAGAENKDSKDTLNHVRCVRSMK